MSSSGHLLTEMRSFVDAEILPRHREMQDFIERNPPGSRPPFLAKLKEKARGLGLWNLGLPNLPSGAPGTRLSNTEFAPIAELLGQIHWAPEVFNCHAPDLPTMEMLVQLATPEQKAMWLAPLLEGRIKSGFAMTEPEVASSDARNISCRIDVRGDRLVINGHKWFFGNFGLADLAFGVVIGVTDPDAQPTHRHTAVIVPIGTPGLDMVREVPVLGFQHRFRPHGEIRLHDVEVPITSIVGERGKGFAAAQVRLATARIHHCMRMIGAAELVLSLMIARARSRRAFGKTIIEHDKIQEYVALSRIEIEQARLLTLNAAKVFDERGGKGARREIAMIKYAVAQAAHHLADRAVQIFGAAGITGDTPIADFYAQTRALRIYDGPDEVHIRTIAQQELAAHDPAMDHRLLERFCRAVN